MPSSLPAIDGSTCSAWTENQIDMYNSYDFFLAKTQVNRRQQNMIFSKLIKRKPWKPNHGPLMRGVRSNPSPVMRQVPAPNPMTAQPKLDTYNVAETKTDAILYWQDFDTPTFYFLPSFNDFMDHVDEHSKDLMRQIEIYEEQFIRGMMFHMSPFIFIAKEDSMLLVNTIPFDGLTAFNPATMGKSTAILSGLVSAHGDMSHITMRGLSHAMTQASVKLGMVPFSGSGLQPGDDKALEQKFLLVTGEESYTQFSFDPYLQNFKNCELDVVNGQFTGSLFGRMTSRLESQPMHMKADGTFPAPEIRVDNDLALNQGESLPNPVYAELTAGNSPYAISFLMGEVGFDGISVGPPPSAFAKDTPPDNFPGMQWNGEVKMTKDFLLECVDPSNGQMRYKTNDKGRYLKFIATLALGIFPRQRRSVIPILHKRKQVV